MYRLLLLLLAPAFAFAADCKDPVDYVSPLIGTGHFGKTFPGAATPGGMVQLSPDTITGGDHGSGYRYFHKTIQGFSFTHMGGVGWFGDLGNFLVMPTTGPLRTYYGQTDHPGTGYLSAFSHETEMARAGYYSVFLDDYKVRAEMTAAPHSGILRFTFPSHKQSRIQIDLARRVGGTSLRQKVRVLDDHTIEGEIDCTPDGGGWGHGAGHACYTVFFHAEFSRALENFGVWRATLPSANYRDVLADPSFIQACQNAEILPGCREKEGQHLGFYSEFPTKEQETVQLKVGISYVSIEGAKANLAAEIPGWDFQLVQENTRAAWSTALERVRVEGGFDEQKTAFYTAVYRSLLDPRIFADLNGHYPGGDGKAQRAQGYTRRTVFSGWDVYRSEFPLLTLIAPDTVNDLLASFVDLADQNQSHYFDRWEFLNAYSGCMDGSPAVIVLNDAYKKGIRGYDFAKAYQYAVNTCERNWSKGRGYIPDSLSKTLEGGLAWWNLAELAKEMNRPEEAEKFERLGRAYRALFDPQQAWTYSETDARPEWKGWFRARNGNGEWAPWLGLCSRKTCTEASVYQQGWLVPHDIPGLMELLGGKELFLAKLTDFFDRSPDVEGWSGSGRKGSNEVLTPYYNHPNEPVHLMPFLFNRAGAPWLTQKWVRRIDQAYQAGPEGLCGDEDVGQMSAWFVLAASGLHPACPGDTRYELFTPLFDKIAINLDPKYAKGKTFIVTARNNSPENCYIQSATLNGKPLERCWLDYSEITAGGSVELVLGPKPNPQWGIR